jgi:hypothetical protein
LGEANLWSCTLGFITTHASFTSPTRLDGVVTMGTQHRGARWDRARYTEDVLLLLSIELFPLRGEPEILNKELLELAAGERTKRLFDGCSCSRDVMHQFMSASIIQFVSANLTNCFEQIGVSVRLLKRSDGSRHRRRMALPRNGT